MAARQIRDISVEKAGDKIILPEGMEEATAIEWLQKKMQENETTVNVYEEVVAFPLEGAYALQKALAEKYGWVNLSPTPGFFGSRPPTMVAVDVGVDKKVSVPWGRFKIPGVEGWVGPSVANKDGRPIFLLIGEVLRKHLAEVQEIARLVRKFVRDESIYRGQALRVKFGGDDFDVNDGPKFLDISKVDADDLTFSKDVQRQINVSVFAPVEKTNACRKMGVPLKRGVLLEGPYGTGKTLTAFMAAKKCQENGWTFLLLENVANLARAIQFAQQYQPAMIFAEDIDRVMDGKRDHEMDAILNTIDGLESKGTEIFVVLTTNHVENINPAMLRPGRLDAVISVRAPDAEAVERLLRRYGRGQIPTNENLETVAQKLEGRIPAYLREVVERAKLAAILEDHEVILADDLEVAADSLTSQLELMKPKVEEKNPLLDFAKTLGAQIADGFENVSIEVNN